jgi:hypothetical protein
MSRSLRNRLDRLEARAPDTHNLPPRFWAAYYGEVPKKEIHPETARLIAWLCKDSRNEPNAINEMIRARTQPQT